MASGLREAVVTGDVRKVITLVGRGFSRHPVADVNGTDAQGRTPLHLAAIAGQVSVADALLTYGARVDAADWSGYTPLLLASGIACSPMVQLLLRYRAGVGAAERTTWRGVLHCAALALSPAENPSAGAYRLPAGAPRRPAPNVAVTMGLLLDGGAEIGKRDYLGWTPLHAAAQAGNRAAVELLLVRGADCNVRDIDGRTPRELAAARGLSAIVGMLR